MLTGDNGILKKASKANKESDIADTKEQIKIEIMGNLDEGTVDYTNQDVITAVKKITGIDIEEKAATVKSPKGNDIPISDLWKIEYVIYFPKIWSGGHIKVPYKVGQVWTKEFIDSFEEEAELDRCSWSVDSRIVIKPDSFSEITITLNEKFVNVGDPLEPGALYDYVSTY